MESAGVLVSSQGLEVVGLEVGRLPRARHDHVGCQVCLLLLDLEGEFGALGHLEADDLLHLDQFSLSQVGQDLGLVGSGLLDLQELGSGDILDRLGLKIKRSTIIQENRLIQVLQHLQ